MVILNKVIGQRSNKIPRVCHRAKRYTKIGMKNKESPWKASYTQGRVGLVSGRIMYDCNAELIRPVKIIRVHSIEILGDNCAPPV